MPAIPNQERVKYKSFMDNGFLTITSGDGRMEIKYHILQSIFLSIMIIGFGPTLLSIYLLGGIDLQDAPTWAKFIAFLVMGAFTTATLFYLPKLYLKPTRLVLDHDLKQITFQNPYTKNYYPDKPWPSHISAKDINNYSVEENYSSEDHKKIYTVYLNLTDKNTLSILNIQNEEHFKQITDYLNTYLGIKLFRDSLE